MINNNIYIDKYIIQWYCVAESEVTFMTQSRLASWVLIATLVSNFSLQTANIALAKPAQPAVSESQSFEVVSINKASSEDLQKVRGIGPSLAERIITYRTTSGGFKSLDELKQVRGIGDLKFEKIKNQITM